ncbi:prolyl hydroxylase EGLN3 [Eucyclogobius newberryi]|uniref:prolyl hydroxylase EGLN3 n=1 Tax=Eucyclogobius newberryi TaxID=166745 RepID=UPI003B5B2430
MPSARCWSDVELDRVVSQRVVPALSAQGFCWLDGVLGEVGGAAVLEQVRRMHLSGALKGGRLMRAAPGLSGSAVRGDKIAWLSGAERGGDGVNALLMLVDKLVSSAARRLQRHISHRSKAMVACYPGGGAGYVKHVDNPSNDGRCITCIYYLNQNWNSADHGGVLRIFPEGKPYEVDIEPLFDRLVLFWSDRRNPHEVLPSHATRYAVTVWYFDSQEREEAKRLCRERNDSENSTSSDTSVE